MAEREAYYRGETLNSDALSSGAVESFSVIYRIVFLAFLALAIYFLIPSISNIKSSLMSFKTSTGERLPGQKVENKASSK